MNRQQILAGAVAGAMSTVLAARPHGAKAGTQETQTAGGSAAPLPWDRHRQITVAFVVGQGATVIDFAGPWEVFQDAMLHTGPGPDDMIMPFQTAMVSDKKSALEATNGMLITPRYTYDSLPVPPNVIVMGAQGQHTPQKIAWIREASKTADVVMSVCTGAFLLAKTGLLDGLHATTHHDFYDRFAKQFPAVALVRGPRFVDNGKLATAGGLTSGIELALHIVERYMGPAATRQTAYYMEYNRSPLRPRSDTAA